MDIRGPDVMHLEGHVADLVLAEKVYRNLIMKKVSDKIRIEGHSGGRGEKKQKQKTKNPSLIFKNVNVIQNKKGGDCFKWKETKGT